MTSFTTLVFLMLAALVRSDWDLAVATEDRVELMTTKGTVVGWAGTELRGLAALTYDIVHSHLFLADNKHPNASIFRVHVSPDAKTSHMRPLVAKAGRILGVAYDVIDNKLYWTTSKLIMMADVIEGSARMAVGSVLHSFRDESPHGIAVDPCRRYLYWTNSNFSCPSIERSRLDGSEREVLVKDGLGMPVGLTFMHNEASLYWVVQNEGGLSFQIERAKLDGTGRELVVFAEYHSPISMAAIPGKVFWTDAIDRAVWSMEVNPETMREMSHKGYEPEPNEVKRFMLSPKGIVARNRDTHIHEEDCREIVELINKVPTTWSEEDPCQNGGRRLPNGKCWCERGFEGEHCENSVCHQYCMGGAECKVTGADNQPVCDCPPELTGDRCQLDSNICHLMCSFDPATYNNVCRCDVLHNEKGGPLYIVTNNSLANTNVTSADAVTASETDTGSSSKHWKLAALSLACLCGLLTVATLVSSYKAWALRKRPRLKRRYKVNPPPQRGNLNTQQADHCEIAIENCCNMNICETPCCEPEFRTINESSRRSTKEEKKGLLDNIETQSQPQ